MVKPKPISAVAVRTHDMRVRSTLRRVRSHAKWLSEVTRTSKRSAPPSGLGSCTLVRLAQIAFEEIREEGADHGDRGHAAEVFPAARNGDVHEVGGELEREGE